MLLSDYMAAVVADLQANATFLKEVGTHGRILGADELKRLILMAPAVRIAMVGTRGAAGVLSRHSATNVMLRTDEGQFRGPLQMIAFLIEQDLGADEARDRAIALIDQFINFIEHRTFGLSHHEAGPALVTGFEILYAAEIDAQGAAIATVTWEQEVVFGRNLHLEDEAMLIEQGYPDFTPAFPGAPLFTEGQYEQAGWHSPAEVSGKGKVTPQFEGDGSDDTEEHEPV